MNTDFLAETSLSTRFKLFVSDSITQRMQIYNEYRLYGYYNREAIERRRRARQRALYAEDPILKAFNQYLTQVITR